MMGRMKELEMRLEAAEESMLRIHNHTDYVLRELYNIRRIFNGPEFEKGIRMRWDDSGKVPKRDRDWWKLNEH